MIPARRLPDWEARFGALVVRAHARIFQWGAWDCCMWAADAVQAVTGVDPAVDLRGRYAGRRQAQQILRELGGLAGAAGRAGMPIPPLQATQADVGLVRGGFGIAPRLAVMVGSTWMCAASFGLTAVPPDRVLRAWGVGRG